MKATHYQQGLTSTIEHPSVGVLARLYKALTVSCRRMYDARKYSSSLRIHLTSVKIHPRGIHGYRSAVSFTVVMDFASLRKSLRAFKRRERE